MTLPASGSLSIKSSEGASRSISLEVDGNETGVKTLTGLRANSEPTVGPLPITMADFLGHQQGGTLAAPSNVVCSQVFTGCNPLQLDVSWTSNSGGNEDTFNIQYRTTTTSPTWIDAGNDTTSPMLVEIPIADVNEGNTIDARVRAVGSGIWTSSGFVQTTEANNEDSANCTEK